MKAAARQLVVRGVASALRHFGPGIREPLIDAIAHGTRHAAYDGVIVSGANGVICGHPDDATTMRTYAHARAWSLDLIELFRSTLREGGTYIDVGANIGLTTIPIAGNPLVACHACEPSPANLTQLRRNLALNDCSTVTVHPVAVCAEDGDLTLELSAGDSGDNRIRTNGNSNGALRESSRQTVTVPGRRLDALIPQPIRRPLVVKMDVQGAEPFVVAGGRCVLAHADLVSLEFWPYGLQRLGGDVDALIAFCRDTFREGSVSDGDGHADAPQWRPMTEIADTLTRYRHRADLQFLNVLLRR